MKKIIPLLVFAFVLSLSLASPAFAANLTPASSSKITEIHYFADGSRCEISIEEPIANGIVTMAATSTKTGNKTYTYYNSGSNEVMWYLKVTGTFSYNGNSATCTSSSVTAASNSSDWKMSNLATSKSGNKANASATAKKYLLGICIQTINEQITLTCSASGTLS